jgi:four helix bundle protein
VVGERMNYQEWVAAVPREIKDDSLWNVKAYRLALFLADLGWHDVTKLMRDRRTVGLAGQLARALGSVGANLAEGYSRGSGKDRARFYEYALGSARESRHWYHQGRHILGHEVVQHRLALLTEIVKLLLVMVPQQRGRPLRDGGGAYDAGANDSPIDVPVGQTDLP